MRPYKVTYTPAGVDLDGYADDVTAAAGEPFPLSATEPGDGLAHLVVITPSGAVTGNYTISGLSLEGVSISEVLATDGGSDVSSAKFYAEVTSVLAPSGLGSETVDIGWSDDCVVPVYPLNWRQDNFQVSLAVFVTGTTNYTVQHTFNELYSLAAEPPPLSSEDYTWWPHATLVTKTASADGNYAFPVTATRLLINLVTDNPTLTFFVVQGK
jgi:hypothetical protein